MGRVVILIFTAHFGRSYGGFSCPLVKCLIKLNNKQKHVSLEI